MARARPDAREGPGRALVLAGGGSRRMGPGLDKVSLELDGAPALRWLVNRLQAMGLEVIVSARPRQALVECDAPVVRDPVDDGGPLAGIRAGLEAWAARAAAEGTAASGDVLVLSCDAIAVQRGDVAKLAAARRAGHWDAAIAEGRDARRQYLVGVYELGAALAALRRLPADEGRVRAWIDAMRVTSVHAVRLSSPHVGAPCNTPAQWREVCSALGVRAPALEGAARGTLPEDD